MDMDKMYGHNSSYWVGRLSMAVQVALYDISNRNVVAAESTLREILHDLEQNGPAFILPPWSKKYQERTNED